MSEPMILLNSMAWNTSSGVVQLPAGRVITSQDDQTSIAAAGGQLWPSSDPQVAAAADYVTSQRLNRGINEELATSIMMLAANAALLTKSANKGFGD